MVEIVVPYFVIVFIAFGFFINQENITTKDTAVSLFAAVIWPIALLIGIGLFIRKGFS